MGQKRMEHIIQIIKPADPDQEASRLIRTILLQQLKLGSVLLLLSGGSATKVYRLLSKTLAGDLSRLTVGLVDERWHLNPHHDDANDKAIRATGLFERVIALGGNYEPILQGGDMNQDVSSYQGKLAQLFTRSYVVAVLGIGMDGHTAGILPGEDEVEFNQRFNGSSLVVGYHNDGPYPWRITLTLSALKQTDTAIVIATDPAKKNILDAITAPALPSINQTPATILAKMKEVLIVA